MRFQVTGTNAQGVREQRFFDTQHVADAIGLAMDAGLYHPIDARPIRDPYGSACVNTRAHEAHAVRLEMQSTPYWGQA